ncbi:Uncharacterised protein [Vibrio cholerae]|nr:Uncharacterised protein [Vibrio cholerae]
MPISASREGVMRPRSKCVRCVLLKLMLTASLLSRCMVCASVVVLSYKINVLVQSGRQVRSMV